MNRWKLKKNTDDDDIDDNNTDDYKNYVNNEFTFFKED